ncbi:MAG: glycerol-3-phosphate acyltransferase PlsX [Saprospiraceae bacterium]|jgi:glycerol-3-phosphate acyltransferase PlsX
MTTISVDVMGGDQGLPVTVPAVINALNSDLQFDCILVGDEQQINASLDDATTSQSVRDRIQIQHATQVVEMDEAPAMALRKKKDSSMRLCIEKVKSQEADACVSAGNTGALMATARFVLKTIEGIDRPAICSAMPRLKGVSHILDLGANVDSSAESLLQFGLMGAAVVKSLHHSVEQPSVALLNIGSEDVKGNELIKQAAELFKASHLNYVGYVEGDDIFMGNTDVIVCDGFVGNVALKTSEGLAQMVNQALREEFSRTLSTKLSALFAKPVLQALKNRIDHRRYNGASFVGLNGIVIKSHGGTDVLGFESAIKVAIKESRAGIIENIKKRL